MSTNSSYIWVPWESGYKEHLDRLNFSHDQVSTIREQTNQFKNAIHQHVSDQTKNLIASNEQIISALDSGFNRLSQINERGFHEVTSAVEDLHSDMNYLFGVVIQKLNYQNSILNGILEALKTPRETQIKEYYNQGLEFINQEKLKLAEDCFKKSISLEMGEYFFPSHYQLGLLYLKGVAAKINLVDPKKATDYLLKAYELGDGKEKIDKSFAPVLADCKFFLSQSYYSQLTGEHNADEIELLNNAIKYAEESVELNSNLSQGFYHLAKYSSYAMYKFELDQGDWGNYSRSLLKYFEMAVSIDREYLRSRIKDDPFYDGVFEPNKEIISELIAEMTKTKGDWARYKLTKAQNKIARLERKNISKYFDLRAQFNEVCRQVKLAEKDFQTETYFGFDDCQLKLDSL